MKVAIIPGSVCMNMEGVGSSGELFLHKGREVCRQGRKISHIANKIYCCHLLFLSVKLQTNRTTHMF